MKHKCLFLKTKKGYIETMHARYYAKSIHKEIAESHDIFV